MQRMRTLMIRKTTGYSHYVKIAGAGCIKLLITFLITIL
jgi:hypothetical protein